MDNGGKNQIQSRTRTRTRAQVTMQDRLLYRRNECSIVCFIVVIFLIYTHVRIRTYQAYKGTKNKMIAGENNEMDTATGAQQSRVARFLKRTDVDTHTKGMNSVCNLGCTTHDLDDKCTDQRWYSAWMTQNMRDLRICHNSTREGYERALHPARVCTAIPNSVFCMSVNMLDAALNKPNAMALAHYGSMLHEAGLDRNSVLAALRLIDDSIGPRLSTTGCTNRQAQRVLLAMVNCDNESDMSSVFHFFKGLCHSGAFYSHFTVIPGFWTGLMSLAARGEPKVKKMWFWRILVSCISTIHSRRDVALDMCNWALHSIRAFIINIAVHTSDSDSSDDDDDENDGFGCDSQVMVESLTAALSKIIADVEKTK